jgi:GTP cyclohydrolase-4
MAENKRTSSHDIHNSKTKFYLTRVGIRGVKKPVRVKRPDKAVTLTPTINIYVDLPASLRGSHMSRNAEIANEIVDESVRRPVPGLEDLCKHMVLELLKRHDYASRAEVDMESDFFLERKSYSGKTSLEGYKLRARAKAFREPDSIRIMKTIGVEVRGMTACPCAMETVEEILREKHPGDIPENMPMISHNQRNVTSIDFEVPEDLELEAEDLIEIVEKAQSAPTFEILKRKDEAKLVYDAHMNPKFVEDVVRDILRAILERYPGFPDSAEIIVKSESEESIHKHNAFAERVTTLGELRKIAPGE